MLREFPYSNFHELNLDYILKEVKENNGKVEGLGNEVNVLTGKVDGVERTIHNTVDNIMNQWKEDGTIKSIIEEKEYIFIGDSYGDNPRTNAPWGKACALAMGLDASKWHNLCKAASSWNSSTLPYINQLINYTGDRGAISDIILLAGANDITTPRETILTRAGEMMEYIRQEYPSAKAHVGFIGCGTAFPNNAGARVAYDAFNSLASQGYAVIENALTANHNYGRLEDGTLHPNADATNVIGWSLASYLNGGDFYYSQDDQLTGDMLETSSTGWSTAYGDFKERIKDNRLYLIASRFLLRSSPISVTSDSFFKLGTIRTGYLIGGNRFKQMPCHCTINLGTSNEYTCQGFLTVTDGNVNLKMELNGNATTNVSSIYLGLEGSQELIDC